MVNPLLTIFLGFWLRRIVFVIFFKELFPAVTTRFFVRFRRRLRRRRNLTKRAQTCRSIGANLPCRNFSS